MSRVKHILYNQRMDDFKDFILDQLSAVPDIRAKRMFGGYGLYSGNVFFAIISDGILYFKTSQKTKKYYENLGMKPFSPNKKQTLKNYYEVPPEAIDDREEMTRLAEESILISTP